jgi:hypothetical protein
MDMSIIPEEMNGSNNSTIFVEFQVSEMTEVEKFLNENIFVGPYQSVWSKVIGTGSYIFGILVSVVIFSFVKNEVQEQNKTVINLLLVFAYLLVINSKRFMY